jgi:phosphohistidine phosphatase
MKHLWLIRHAKSSWQDSYLKDFERPLNKRGKRDAPFMGKELKKNAFSPDIVISSPSKRTTLTAEKIFNVLDFDFENIQWEPKLYGAGTWDCVNLINGLDQHISSVCIIGHNPTLTDLSNYLTDDYINNIPTCGIVKILFEINDWSMVSKGLGSLISFDYPKKHLS